MTDSQNYIVEYSRGGLGSLIVAVNERIKDGYVCQGGVCALPPDENGHSIYFQAMVHTRTI